MYLSGGEHKVNMSQVRESWHLDFGQCVSLLMMLVAVVAMVAANKQRNYVLLKEADIFILYGKREFTLSCHEDNSWVPLFYVSLPCVNSYAEQFCRISPKTLYLLLEKLNKVGKKYSQMFEQVQLKTSG